MASSIELLRFEGLIETTATGDTLGDAMVGLTDKGRAELHELMRAAVRAPAGDFSKLVIALKLRFLHLLPAFEQREQIAKEVVRVHCEVTDAPPSFVHAFFSEVSAAELPEGKVAFVLGSIRAGRTPEQKARIVAELTDAIANITGRGSEQIGVATADIPSKWIMEGGELLPEPGEEAEWLERHR